MPDTVDPRITTAREYLTRARRRTITTMPPLALMRELAETRMRLGHALDAITPAALLVSLTEHQQDTLHLVFAEAIGTRERRAYVKCPDCNESATSLCSAHASDFDAISEYTDLARALGVSA
jgi:hypothetical protein